MADVKEESEGSSEDGLLLTPSTSLVVSEDGEDTVPVEDLIVL